jgi:hypothetical protein
MGGGRWAVGGVTHLIKGDVVSVRVDNGDVRLGRVERAWVEHWMWRWQRGYRRSTAEERQVRGYVGDQADRAVERSAQAHALRPRTRPRVVITEGRRHLAVREARAVPTVLSADFTLCQVSEQRCSGAVRLHRVGSVGLE